MKKPAAAGGLPLSRLSELGSRMGQAQRLWILTVAMILATGFIGMVAIQGPWQENRRQLGSHLEDEKQRSELLLSLQRQKGSLQKAEEELLLEGGAPALTGEVSHLATESHLAIESVAPQDDLVVPPYTQFQIEIVATARLENLLIFLQSIENHRPLLTLNELAIGEPVELGLPLQSEQGVGTPLPQPPEEQRIRMKIGALGRQKKPR